MDLEYICRFVQPSAQLILECFQSPSEYSLFFFFWCEPFLKSLYNLLWCRCYFMFGFFGCKTYGILAPRPGIEPAPLCIRQWSLNQWTSKKSSEYSLASTAIPQSPLSLALGNRPFLSPWICLFWSFNTNGICNMIMWLIFFHTAHPPGPSMLWHYFLLRSNILF